jgi:hypothetical protein
MSSEVKVHEGRNNLQGLVMKAIIINVG